MQQQTQQIRSTIQQLMQQMQSILQACDQIENSNSFANQSYTALQPSTAYSPQFRH